MPFVKGQSGNPAGKPKGCRNKASAEFVADLIAAYKAEGGIKYLQRLSKTNKTAFAALMGRLIPKNLEINADVTVLWEDFLQKLTQPVPRESPGKVVEAAGLAMAGEVAEDDPEGG